MVVPCGLVSVTVKSLTHEWVIPRSITLMSVMQDPSVMASVEVIVTGEEEVILMGISELVYTVWLVAEIAKVPKNRNVKKKWLK